jgi:hypothetical protein
VLPPVSRTESTSAPVFCALCAQLKFSPTARWRPSNACAILERAKKQQPVCKTSACAAVVLERENATLLQNQPHPTIWPRPGWRNWQTQRTQNPPGFGPWGFDPPSRHQDSKGLTGNQSKGSAPEMVQVCPKCAQTRISGLRLLTRKLSILAPMRVPGIRPCGPTSSTCFAAPLGSMPRLRFHEVGTFPDWDRR